jgi:ADP-heptose:LPS heptosyltransferase
MKRYRAPYLGFCFNLPPVLEDKGIHVADMFERVVAGIPPATEPHRHPTAKPWLTVAGRRNSGAPKIAFFVDAPVPERIWPAERFAEVADFVIEKFGFSVSIISSKERGELAVAVRDFSRNPDQLSVCTDMNLPIIVQIIGSAVLFVSNDTGPMHLGPAVGTPTLGLFSVGFPEHFRPMGPNDRFLRSNPIHLIQVKDVIAVLEEMWATADRDLQC